MAHRRMAQDSLNEVAWRRDLETWNEAIDHRTPAPASYDRWRGTWNEEHWHPPQPGWGLCADLAGVHHEEPRSRLDGV